MTELGQKFIPFAFPLSLLYAPPFKSFGLGFRQPVPHQTHDEPEKHHRKPTIIRRGCCGMHERGRSAWTAPPPARSALHCKVSGCGLGSEGASRFRELEESERENGTAREREGERVRGPPFESG